MSIVISNIWKSLIRRGQAMKLGPPGDMVAYIKFNMRSAWGSGKDAPRKTGMQKPGIMYTCVCV